MATRPVDMIAPGFPGHNPDIDTPRYDPERARQLLEEAGYGEGLQLRGIYAPTFSVVADEATEAIRQMLLEVGVDLRWERVEPAVTDELTPQKFPGYDLVPSVSRNIGYYPIRDLWQWFHSTNAPSTHNNPEWDQIIEDASRATTEEEYLQQIIAAYETLLVEEAGNIPLFHPLYTLGWRTDRIAEFPHTEGWSVYPRNMHHIVPK